jgi:uncharacterized OB-fold protein
MAEFNRPLPNPKEHDTRAFWEATKERQLRYQKCEACGTVVFYPRAHCTGCVGGKLAWHTASGRGTVYSFSVVRKAEHPFFRTKVPYAVAWIDLDEGPRILSNVVGVADPARDIKVGQRVTVEWEAHDDVALPLFRPV